MTGLGNSFSNLNEAIAYLSDKMPDYRFDKNGKPYYYYRFGKRTMIKKVPSKLNRDLKVSI